MEENFFDKLENEEELKNETVQNISQKNLNVYKKDIDNSKFINTEIIDSSLEKVYFKDILFDNCNFSNTT